MATRMPPPSPHNPSTAEEQGQLTYPVSPRAASEQMGHQHSFPSLLDTGEGWEEVGVEGQYENSKGHPSFNSGTGDNNGGHNAKPLDVPALLKVGRPEGASTSSFGSQSSAELFPPSSDAPPQEPLHEQVSKPTYSTNPYRNRSPSADNTQPDILQLQEQSSVDVWAELEPVPPQPKRAPPPPPIPHDIDGFGDLSISDHQSYGSPPDLPTSQYHSSATPNEDHSLSFSDKEYYQSEDATQQSPFGADAYQEQTGGYIGQKGWVDLEYQHPATEHPETHVATTEDTNYPEPEYAPPPGPPPSHPSRSYRDSSLVPGNSDEGAAPKLPPRWSKEAEVPPPNPARPLPSKAADVTGRSSASRPEAESAQAKATKQRSETYQIKHITWEDSSNNTRTSPIMVQNANGPCPLLALVNALTLSTPLNTNTGLVETLRVREQVSLGLLLDAVFDELMSGRRGDAAQELPDVGELYTFLITLHTGMNVNPRFITDPTSPDLMDFGRPAGAVSKSGHPQPGAFEETREMRLYSTFNVPLIHGWLPARSNPAYDALQRSAKSYEDAQNLMFREEELEDRLQHAGLSFEEQQLLEDITSIRYFLETSATQLTTYGLSTITRNLSSGSLAILFRNDHFSTVYKHPRSGNLLSLVTDMGYAGHPEVVWESLIDVSGEGSSFFAGDFRPVGNNTDEPFFDAQSSARDEGQGWETVPTRTRSKQPLSQLHTGNTFSSSSNPQQPPMSPNTEQEDHDLALALQLQEEEEDRSWRETAQRRHEDQLSRAYLSSETPPPQPPRTDNRSSLAQTATSIRPMIPPRNSPGPSASTPPTRRAPPPARHDPEAGEDAPPPSYEQAAKSEPYIPQPGQPFPPHFGAPVPGMNASTTSTNPHSPTVGIRPQGQRPRQASAYTTHAASVGNLNMQSVHRNSVAGQRGGGGLGGLPTGAGIARRRSAGVGEWEGRERDRERDKDCVIM